jgi:hypothetical protein
MVHAKPKSPQSPVITVPTPKDEQIRLGKVGILAAIGLAAGILWPRMVGLRLVPAPPTDVTSATASASASTSAAVAPSVPLAASAMPANTSANTEDSKSNAATVRPPKVTLAQVISCHSKDGERETHCDTPPVDSLVQTPLQSLIACDAAENARGILSLGFDVDFEGKKFDHFVVGKSTTLAAGVAKQLLHCGEKELNRVSLDGVEHTKSSYRVFYKIEFAGDGTSAPNSASESGNSEASAPSELVAASGRVTVTWDAALVRSKPKDGDVLARVLGGTRLTVTGRQGDWYRVKYDGKGSEGWVFKSAIGL